MYTEITVFEKPIKRIRRKPVTHRSAGTSGAFFRLIAREFFCLEKNNGRANPALDILKRIDRRWQVFKPLSRSLLGWGCGVWWTWGGRKRKGIDRNLSDWNCMKMFRGNGNLAATFLRNQNSSVLAVPAAARQEVLAASSSRSSLKIGTRSAFRARGKSRNKSRFGGV